MADPFNFEAFWSDLRPGESPLAKHDEIQIVSNKAADLDDMLEATCAKASHDLIQKYQKHHGENLTVEILADIVSSGVRVFMQKWHEELRSQNIAGLIEFVLEGQSLTPDEMMGFVRALPHSLLQRVSESAFGAATGIHGLMAVEFARRRGDVRSYTLKPDAGKVLVEFINREDQTVSFHLDEEFKTPAAGVDQGESEDSNPDE